MHSLVLLSFMVLKLAAAAFPTALIGKTPCCIDRLFSSTCTRIRAANTLGFEKRCANDPDFALVQCCSTCFPSKSKNSSSRYEDTVLRLLQSPFKSTCWDRRGPNWCAKLVQKSGFWETPRFSQVGCHTFPFAFRECRQSCGYCSSGHLMTRLNYDFKLATNPKFCNTKTYFARSEEEVLKSRRRKQEFDPLSLLKLNGKKPDDYFVVMDHNYDVTESKERTE